MDHTVSRMRRGGVAHAMGPLGLVPAAALVVKSLIVKVAMCWSWPSGRGSQVVQLIALEVGLLGVSRLFEEVFSSSCQGALKACYCDCLVGGTHGDLRGSLAGRAACAMELQALGTASTTGSSSSCSKARRVQLGLAAAGV